MLSDKRQLTLEETMHEVAEGNKVLARAREDQAVERTERALLDREDTMSVEARPDGTFLCTGYNGRVVLRPRGFRGRS